MNNSWLTCMAIAAMVGCGGGGGSGVDSNKRVIDLSTGEVQDVCEYAGELAGPERTVDCGDGVTVTVGGFNVAECVMDVPTAATSPNCTMTVGEVEACFEALTDLDPCMDTDLPAACAALASAACN